MPGWVTPDRLTALGCAGAGLVFAGYALSRLAAAWLWLAIAGYAVHWFGDSLDGSLARYRRVERPVFGHFLDHSVDAAGNLVAMIGLGLSPFVRLDAALFAVAGYLLMTVHVLLRARATGEMQLSFAGGGPTELRLLLVALTLAMLATGPWPLWRGLALYDVAVVGVGLVLAVLFTLHSWRIAAALRRAGG